MPRKVRFSTMGRIPKSGMMLENSIVPSFLSLNFIYKIHFIYKKIMLDVRSYQKKQILKKGFFQVRQSLGPIRSDSKICGSLTPLLKILFPPGGRRWEGFRLRRKLNLLNFR